MRTAMFLFVVGMALLFSGCASVQPHEKQKLSLYGMRSDRAMLEDNLVDHMLFSREGGFVGKSIGGAGCGCN